MILTGTPQALQKRSGWHCIRTSPERGRWSGDSTWSRRRHSVSFPSHSEGPSHILAAGGVDDDHGRGALHPCLRRVLRDHSRRLQTMGHARIMVIMMRSALRRMPARPERLWSCCVIDLPPTMTKTMKTPPEKCWRAMEPTTITKGALRTTATKRTWRGDGRKGENTIVQSGVNATTPTSSQRDHKASMRHDTKCHHQIHASVHTIYIIVFVIRHPCIANDHSRPYTRTRERIQARRQRGRQKGEPWVKSDGDDDDKDNGDTGQTTWLKEETKRMTKKKKKDDGTETSRELVIISASKFNFPLLLPYNVCYSLMIFRQREYVSLRKIENERKKLCLCVFFCVCEETLEERLGGSWRRETGRGAQKKKRENNRGGKK